MRDGITRLLRRIKDERKRRASAYMARIKASTDGDLRIDVVERKSIFRPRVWATVLGVITVCGVAVIAVWPNLREEPPSYSRLVEQMELAAHGAAPSSHVFGGALEVETRGGNVVITARAVPPTACVNAAWKLGSTGRIAINGMMPPRIIVHKLAKLCAPGEKGATITWFPKK